MPEPVIDCKWSLTFGPFQPSVEKSTLSNYLASPPHGGMMIGIEKALDLNKDGAASPPLPVRIPRNSHVTAFGFGSNVGPSNRHTLG